MAVGRCHGETEHQRQLLSLPAHHLGGNIQGNLRVLHVEDGLYQQTVHATVDECFHLFFVGIAQTDGESGVGMLVGQRACLVGRTDGTQYKPWFVGRKGRLLVGGFASNATGSKVNLAASIAQSVVVHRYALGVEGVGLYEVGPGSKVFAVDIAHDEWCRDREHVVAAFQFLLMTGETCTAEIFFAQLVLLYHCSHGTVEHEDSLLGYVG